MSSVTSTSPTPEDQKSSFPPKAYDAEIYQDLSDLFAPPTVSHIWAKPTTDETAPAEIMVTLAPRVNSTFEHCLQLRIQPCM
jgi:hypothetical protein